MKHEQFVYNEYPVDGNLLRVRNIAINTNKALVNLLLFSYYFADFE